MLYDDNTNRATAFDNFICSYLEDEFGDLPNNLSPVSNNNTGEDVIMPQLAPARPSITFHDCDRNILTGLCAIVTPLICPILLITYFKVPVRINVAYVRLVQQHLQYRL